MSPFSENTKFENPEDPEYPISPWDPVYPISPWDPVYPVGRLSNLIFLRESVESS